MPLADGTLVAVPGGLAGVDEHLLPSLLALTDVAGTGLHGAVLAGVGEGATVAVIGDGAVGLARGARRPAVLGAERVILMSRHEDRAAIGRAFGATDVIAVARRRGRRRRPRADRRPRRPPRRRGRRDAGVVGDGDRHGPGRRHDRRGRRAAHDAAARTSSRRSAST